jgi:hypothetical protein
MAKIILPASRSLTVIDGDVVGVPSQRLVSTGRQLSFDVRAQVNGFSHERAATTTVVFELPPDDPEGSPAPAIPGEGDRVLIVGATRRRFFRTSAGTVSRTEVEAHTVLIGNDRRRARVLREALQWE